jgi:hypothetical protein
VKEIKDEVDTRRSIRKISPSDINPFEMSDCHGREHEETVCREMKACTLIERYGCFGGTFCLHSL